MTHCCACGNAPLMFPLEKAFSVRWSVVYVCVCVWRSATWLLASCHFLLCVCGCFTCAYVCVPEETARGRKRWEEKAKRERESEEMSASEEGGKKADSYRWNSRRLASLPRTGSGPGRHIDRGHTPWCSELLMRNTLFFLITDLALWRKKFKCSVAAAQPRCPTLLHGKDGKQTHKHTQASKQTNKPIKKNCSVYSSSLIFISFWSTLMFYLPVFSFLLVVFRCTLVLAMLTSVLHVSEASQNWTDCKPDWTTISSQRCWSYLAQSRCVLPPQPNNPGRIFHFSVWGENKEKYFSRVTDPSRFPHIFSQCSNSSWASLVTG